jgi:pimeloyl-ACP methyl ester carboxylesterase
MSQADHATSGSGSKDLTRTEMLEVDGAQLYCEVGGDGPPLLMIGGAGGDAGYYGEAARLLGDTFTVITYDRRGNSRSTGRTDGPMTMVSQVSDAKAVIDRLAGGAALVFGNSGGAIIGLALAGEHPESLTGLIAHEPPILKVLPEDDPVFARYAHLKATLEREGVMAAAGEFVEHVRGEGSYEWPAGVPERFAGNLEYLFRNELEAFIYFEPDDAALRSAPFPIVLASGAEDRGCYYATTALVLAERIGAPWSEFPGYHLPFMERPAEFAATLRAVATLMLSQRSAISPDYALR